MPSFSGSSAPNERAAFAQPVILSRVDDERISDYFGAVKAANYPSLNLKADSEFQYESKKNPSAESGERAGIVSLARRLAVAAGQKGQAVFRSDRAVRRHRE